MADAMTMISVDAAASQPMTAPLPAERVFSKRYLSRWRSVWRDMWIEIWVKVKPFGGSPRRNEDAGVDFCGYISNAF
jgi:hypothetical protein